MHKKHDGVCLLILGIVLILVRMYTPWDIWVVLGTLLILKGLVELSGCCETPTKKKKR